MVDETQSFFVTDLLMKIKKIYFNYFTLGVLLLFVEAEILPHLFSSEINKKNIPRLKPSFQMTSYKTG